MAKTQDFNKHAYVKQLSPISQEDQSETTNKTSVKWVKSGTKSAIKPTENIISGGANNQYMIDHMSNQFTFTEQTGPTPNLSQSIVSRPQGVELNPYSSIEGKTFDNKNKGRRKKRGQPIIDSNDNEILMANINNTIDNPRTQF